MSHRLLLAALLLPSLVAAGVAPQGDEKPAKIKVAELVLGDNAAEDPIPDAPLGPTRRNFRGRLEQIRAIAGDPAIRGVRLVVKGAPSFAHCLDLLAELSALKRSGKKVACYAEDLSRSQAMLATTADLLVVPPTGMIALEGMTAEMMYMKDLLAKVDARVEVLHIGEYKTAFENLARDSMSDGQREVIEALLDEFYGQLVTTLAQNRGLPTAVVEGLFERLLVDPMEAAAAGFIDAAVYEDEFERKAQELFGGEFELVEDYGDRTKEDVEQMLKSPFAFLKILELLNPPQKAAPKGSYIAVVYASGAITSGKSKSDFSGNVSSMGSDTIVEALQEAGKDDNCKAVVLRVNSPGGSALASDMIWRAIQEVRKSKPVVSSMGSVAASGGYWISMGCDAIVAQPSTITGSIGVVSMLPDLSQTVRDLGINVQVVGRGPHGDQLSLLAHGPTPILKDTITRWMNQVYELFLSKVSAGRKLPVETVAGLAHGRVWTGRQAVENGLVDELGGLRDALDLACALGGGLDPGQTPIVELPEPPNVFEAIEEAMEDLASTRSPAEQLAVELGFGELLATVSAVLGEPRALAPERVLAVLPFQVVWR